ncbi:MAG: NADH-quinone oxidoreductase subunit L [Chloroflexi bacterium]|nr:NADH-quinone oxidoreductase subunit L [Chloroflexota bacterium]
MFNYAFLIPIFPLLAFVLIVFFLNRNNRVSALTAVAGIFAAGVVAYLVLFEAISKGGELAQHPFFQTLPLFLQLPTGAIQFQVGVLIDPIVAMMLFMVTTVCLMIFIYSIGYMQHSHTDEHGHHHVTDDPRYARFFAYISLFACGMLGLVISSNLFQFFLFWEIMGLCSYLLIGFWSIRKPNEHHIDDAQTVRAKFASLKAFLTTRVGDTIFFVGLVFLYIQSGDLNFPKIFTAENLEHLAEAQALPGLPWVTLIALLILGGTIGKSAQFPLHVWLPDAMEGPTPVSALIHAATMVAAGVFLIARTYPLFITAAETGGPVMTAVAIVGAFTALFAGTIGVAQDDIKRVLAYSTVSQLGFMVAALGIGAYVAGAFHLITHAFFKALLFMSAGSVIHGVGTNDMMNMGGLRKKMPITTTVFIIGALALAGIPPLAGFWSKDEIIAHAFEQMQHGETVGTIVFIFLAIAAFFTAFYMTRQIFLTFFGEGRDHHAYDHAHESPTVMWAPLAVLAVFAATIGFINATPLGINFFEHFVGEGWMGIAHAGEEFEAGPFNPTVALTSTGLAVAGIVLGWLIYGWKPLKHGQRDPLSRIPLIWQVLRNKYYADELYGLVIAQKSGSEGKTGTADSVRVQPGLFIRFIGWIADVSAAFDKAIVDGLVNLAAAIGRLFSAISGWIDHTIVDGLVNVVGIFTDMVGDAIKLIQTGRVQNYLLIAIAGVALFAFLFLIK